MAAAGRRQQPEQNAGESYLSNSKNKAFNLGIGTFVREDGGYTSIAVACALLVSLALTCSLVSVAWIQNRSADVQATADAAALSAANVVSSYTTVATTFDACVLTLGLAGIVTLGAGLVVSAVPGMSAAGVKTIDSGMKVLQVRNRFATSSAKGLKAIEATLPLAMATRSFAVVEANDTDAINYAGAAIGFPQQSESDFSALETDVSGDKIEQAATKLQEASDKAKEAQEKADAAKQEGWLADCGGDPMSMWERAGTVGSLSSALNPYYSSAKSWTFGAALVRARNYYPRRASIETPLGTGIDALTDSACRLAFYEYASAKVRGGHYTELADGRVDIDLPELPANPAQMKETTLYTDVRWPCTQESAGRTLHSVATCPGATGAASGKASLAQLDAGQVMGCPTCKISSADLGSVGAASTSIENGFEHYWQRVIEASRAYQQACDELVEATQQMKGLADEGASAFEEALEALSVPRPKLCPPGAWGCVSVVARGSSSMPAQLSNAFAGQGSLPAGAAASAAVLAPDSDSDGNDVLTRLFEAIGEDVGDGDAGVIGKIGELWGKLLKGYGSAVDGLSSAADAALSVTGESGLVASWLKDRLCKLIKAAGFAPADLRLRKPVLTNTQNVLEKSGYGNVSTVRDLIGKLPASGDAASIAAALGQQITNELGGSTFTVAELPIPGTDITLPLTLDVNSLLGVT